MAIAGYRSGEAPCRIRPAAVPIVFPIHSFQIIMNQSTQTLPVNARIGWIEAGWHHDIVVNARHSFQSVMADNGLPPDAVDVVRVPGSLEIPLQCQRLARTGHYHAIVACGLIVDGGIYRHDFVASTVLDAMMKVQLDTEVPVLSVVLTPHHFTTEPVHLDFFSDHFRVKGREAAEACLQTLVNMMAMNHSPRAA